MIQARGALMVVALTIGARASAVAQAKVSCGPLALVTVKVVDAAGHIVKDARIEVLRRRDKLRMPTEIDASSPSGEYTIIDDGSLAKVSPSGEAFLVRVTRGKRLTQKTFRIGRTPDGCHIRLLSGQPLIVARR